MTMFSADDTEPWQCSMRTISNHDGDCGCYRATGEFSFWHYQTADMNTTTKMTSIIIIIYMYVVLFRSKSGMPYTRKARGDESHDLVTILHLCVFADHNFIRKRLDHPQNSAKSTRTFSFFRFDFQLSEDVLRTYPEVRIWAIWKYSIFNTSAGKSVLICY